MILTGFLEKSDIVRVQASQYQVLMTSIVVKPASTRAFCINGVWPWLFLRQSSIKISNYTIKQLLTFEVLDMT